MKKHLLLSILMTICFCATAGAQIIIVNDNMFQKRMSEIKTTVLDSLTNEPVGFASVYVVPVKDTTITNFTLTDANGEAKLEEVPFGNYVFHVEMMGYKPFIKERYFRESKVDMGTIRLKQDDEFLEAAVISDVTNPIVMKKDTVEFNASSYRVGANAMLKDLIKRMPGMEITADGKVKFNGEEIDKITIGGRTFFFGDQSAALNNLPASVVDKVRVIDKQSKDTRATGVEDGTKEKVLDVALKKEYQEGWFGNAGLLGGSTLGKKDDDPLRSNPGVLYNANLLASGYTEKDQLTLIANTQNISEGNEMHFVIIDDDEEVARTSPGGLTKVAQIGLNANTSRIKDVETTVSGNYKYGDKENGSRSYRTTYQDGGDLETVTDESSRQYTYSSSVKAELEKEKGKVWFYFQPSFRYNKTDNYNYGTSEITRQGAVVNSSESNTHSISEKKDAGFDGNITFKELWGKKERSIRVNASASFRDSNGNSDESSVFATTGGKDTRVMKYVSDGDNAYVAAGIRYTEPLGSKWLVSAMVDYYYSRRNNNRDAFDAAGRNDYYSSKSRTNNKMQESELTLQYKFGEDSWFTLGGRLIGMMNENISRSFGVDDVTGKGEWNWYVTPTMRFRHTKGNDRFSAYASGYSRRPAASYVMPVMNIANPSRPFIGNIYLKPGVQTYFDVEWRRSNKEKYKTLSVYFYGRVMVNPINNAMWYDNSGILYSVPVNSKKPDYYLSGITHYTFPLDSKKIWSLRLSGGLFYNFSSSYQTGSVLPGLDKDSFDYSAFMADFWGDASGDRFYSGKSGFTENKLRSLEPYAALSLKLNQDCYSIVLDANTSGSIADYSLYKDFSSKIWDHSIGLTASYTAKHDWDFESEISYNFYSGYAEGYGKSEWQWNAEISKSIGAFNLSLKVHDILNQTNYLNRTIKANYKEDSYNMIIGRYVMFGVKWNFGKMNATHSQRAQNAAWNMVW